MKVRVLSRARVQARRARDWWRKNRPAAPALFEDELTAALRRIADNPEIGAPFHDPEVPGLRRVLLAASRYHLYYLYDPQERRALVLALWSAVRGRGRS